MSTGASISMSLTDFWRSGPAGATLPDGVTDTTDSITHNGRTGIGNIGATGPVAFLDVANGARTAIADPRSAASLLYATATLPVITPFNQPSTPLAIAEIRHSNQQQGIGFAYNGMYAAGAIANADFIFLNRGNGRFEFQWQAANADRFIVDKSTPSVLINNQTFSDRFFFAGVERAQVDHAFVESTAPVNIRTQWFITSNGVLTRGMRLQPDMAQPGSTTLYVGEQSISNRKLVLWEGGAASLSAFYGFGVGANEMRYQVPAVTSAHDFYGATTLAFRVIGDGTIIIPVAPDPGVPGDRLLVRDPATGEIRQGVAIAATQDPSNHEAFAGTGNTNASGNVTFTFVPPFPAVPIVTATIGPTANTSFLTARITALSVNSCTVNVKGAPTVNHLGNNYLGEPVNVNNIPIQLIAVEAGRVIP